MAHALSVSLLWLRPCKHDDPTGFILIISPHMLDEEADVHFVQKAATSLGSEVYFGLGSS